MQIGHNSVQICTHLVTIKMEEGDTVNVIFKVAQEANQSLTHTGIKMFRKRFDVQLDSNDGGAGI